MERKIVNIVLITDKNYAKPTYVTLLSLSANKDFSSKYEVTVLYSEIDDVDLANIKNLHRKDFAVHVQKITFDCNQFKKNNFHVSPVAITKFMLPLIFSDKDKILYLDGDLIVQGDLSELYETNIDEKYAAVVKDMSPMIHYQPNICERLGISHKNYFNSGVMLLNLKKMRQDQITDKLLEYRQNGINFFMDQDALNVCFREQVEYLSLKYNFIVTLEDRFSADEICTYYDETQENIFGNSIIIHFASPYKPWKCYDSQYADIWMSYFKKSPYNQKLIHRISRHSKLCALFGLKKQVVVSLTSYPARINMVQYTIYSLLNQSANYDKIILYLGKDKFPNLETDLPQELINLCGDKFEIHWVEKDLCSFTKLIPALKEYPDALIVTADDDIVYPYRWLELLLLSYVKNPTEISCHRAHKIIFEDEKIKPYRQWKFSYPKACVSYNNFLTGVGGVLYPPHCLSEDVFDEEKFMRLCPQADDIWFWAMAIENNTQIRIVENNITRLEYIEGTQEVGLCYSNVREEKNDVQLQNVLNEYPEILDKLDKMEGQIEKITSNEIVKLKKHEPKHLVIFKLFNCIPLITYRKCGGKKVWKFFGVPVWKIRKKSDNVTTKYYFCGIPLVKYSNKFIGVKTT